MPYNVSDMPGVISQYCSFMSSQFPFSKDGTLLLILCCVFVFGHGQEVSSIANSNWSANGQLLTVREVQKSGAAAYLSSRVITSLYFEGEHRIWMASDDGLLMFDGISVQTFFPVHRKGWEVRPFVIYSISEGVILLSYTSKTVASSNITGMDVFDTRSKTFQPLAFPNTGKRTDWLFDFSDRGIFLFDPSGGEYMLDLGRRKWTGSRRCPIPREINQVASDGEKCWGLASEKHEIWQLGQSGSRLWASGVRSVYSHEGNRWDVSLGFRKASAGKFELLRFDYNKGIHTIVPIEEVEGTEEDDWTDIYVTPATKEIWVHHRSKGLLVAHDGSDGKKNLVLPIQDIIGHNQIQMVAAKGNHIFIAVNGVGFFWLKRHPSPLVDVSPSMGSVRSFFVAGDSLLIGSYSGLYTARATGSRFPSPVKTPGWFDQLGGALSSDDAVVYAFYEDKKGQLWMGLTSRLVCIGKDGKAKSYETPAAFACGDIWSIVRFDDTTFLLGSDAGVGLFDMKGGKWDFTGSKTRNIPRTYGFIRESDAVWLAYGENGFSRLRFKAKYLYAVETAFSGLRKQAVLFVFRESNRSWWIGTRAGLIHFDPLRGDFLHEDILACFKGREVYAIYPDWKGNLWASSNDGLFTIQSDRRSVFRYGAEHGLSETEFNRNAHCSLADGRFLFGSIKGVTQAFPELYKQISPASQLKTVVFTDADTRLVRGPGKRSVSIPGGTEGIYVDIEGLFTFSHDTRYAYRIPEQDSTWQVFNGRRVYIHPLPPGGWTLQLYRDLDGTWQRLPDMAFVKKIALQNGIVWLVFCFVAFGLGVLAVRGKKQWAIVLGAGKESLQRQATKQYPVVQEALPEAIVEDSDSFPQEEKNQDREEKNYWVRRFYTLLEVHYSDPDLSVSKLASLLGLSERTMFRIIKEATNRTPNDCLQEFRLLKAHNAIAENPSKTISQVLFETGFNTPSYFSRRFAERFGLSPREFQKQCLAKKG